MSRTDLDPATLAASLRRMAGDGSVEWVTEPMQTRVLLDVADLLDENAKLREEFNKMDVWHSKELTAAMDENAKLRELCADMHAVISDRNSWWDFMCKDTRRFADRMRELGIDVDA